MRKRLATAELLALLAIAGVTSSGVAMAANNDQPQGTNALKVQTQPEHAQLAEKAKKSAGKDSACGKGSCGTDESGAKAAAAKHEKKSSKHAKKAESKQEAKETKEAK